MRALDEMAALAEDYGGDSDWKSDKDICAKLKTNELCIEDTKQTDLGS